MGLYDKVLDCLHYDTVRYARIRHTGFGMAYVFGCLAIGGYLLVNQILIVGAHLGKRSLQGVSRISLATPFKNNHRCFKAGCGHTFTPDINLPYCERFVQLQDGDTLHTLNVKRKLPCVLYDHMDATMGSMDESSAIVPTRLTSHHQDRGCPEEFKPESGYGVNHSSYFCNKSHHTWLYRKGWDGYVTDVERFRIIILHSVSVDMPDYKNKLFSNHEMQGKYHFCRKEGGKRICEWKPISCVHERCGLKTNRDESEQGQSASSLSQMTQESSDQNNIAVDAWRFQKSHSSSKKAKLKMGLQSHLGFLEYVPPKDTDGSSRDAAGIVSQDVGHTNSTHRDPSQLTPVNETFPVKPKKRLDKWNEELPWSDLGGNIDPSLRGSLDLDHGLYQGEFGLITSVDFLLEMAGISSLDEELKYANSTLVPRDSGIHLQITFEYLNWQRGRMEFKPSRTPSYTMMVEQVLAHEARFEKWLRTPPISLLERSSRREILISGVKITVLHTGEFRILDMGQLIIVLTSALGLYAGMKAVLDFIFKNFSNYSAEFTSYKFKESKIVRSLWMLATPKDIQHEIEDAFDWNADVEKSAACPSEQTALSAERPMTENARGDSDGRRSPRGSFASDVNSTLAEHARLFKEMEAKIARLEGRMAS